VEPGVRREWRPSRESIGEGAAAALLFAAFSVGGLVLGEFRWPALFAVWVGALLLALTATARSSVKIEDDHLIVDNGLRRPAAIRLADVRTCTVSPHGLRIFAIQRAGSKVPERCRPFKTLAPQQGDRGAQHIAFAVRSGGLLHRSRRTAVARQIADEIVGLAEIARERSGHG
jgi:hypothetical protein